MNFLVLLKKIYFKIKSYFGGKPLVSANFDIRLMQRTTGRRFPGWQQIWHIKKVISPKEKLVTNASLLVLLIGALWFGVALISRHRTPVPAVGGVYIEASVGTPQLINPLFAGANDADTDIVRLVYSGLMRYDGEQRLVADLAASYNISNDKKTYTFALKKDVTWHDGEKFTAKDVLFTFEAIQNSAVNSPLNISFQNVKVTAPDDYTVVFELPQVFSAFLASLTVGILPEHVWFDIQPEQMRFAGFNLKPIGTGPFMFKKLVKDDSGRVYQYELARFENYYRLVAYLQGFVFQFYPGYEGDTGAIQALREAKVNGLNFVPYDLRDKVVRKHIDLHVLKLPQYTALFFNQDHKTALRDKNLRQALSLALDKDRILREVVKNEGQVIYGPILPGMPGYNAEAGKVVYSFENANKLLDAKWSRVSAEDYRNSRREEIVKEILNQAVTTTSTPADKTKIIGKLTVNDLTVEQKKTVEDELNREVKASQTFYRKDKDGKILELNITTVDSDQYKKTAELVAGFWQEVGVKVNVSVVSVRDMVRNVLKNRDYDVLLYGEIVGDDPDPYPFWHSSQTDFPGLNLARYINRNADAIMDKIRSTSDETQLVKLYSSFQDTLAADYPAIFLYMPTYTYATTDNVNGIQVKKISSPDDRFADVTEWYMKTTGQWHW